MATVGNVAQDNQGGMLVAVAIALLPTQESVPVGRSNFGSPKVRKIGPPLHQCIIKAVGFFAVEKLIKP